MCLKLLSVILFLFDTIVAFQQVEEYVVVSTTPRSPDINTFEERLQTIENTLHSLELQNAQIQKSLDKLNLQLITPTRFPRHCKEIQERGENVSGFYHIQPQFSAKSFVVLCDMKTRGGGWTYFLNRFDGSQDFYLNWNSYKEGFGNLAGEFWLGLEPLYQLTGYEANELLLELVDWDLKKVHAHYGIFSIGSEVEGYSLKVLGEYSGDTGDSLIYDSGAKFSTKDRNQDDHIITNCASYYTGAWWYKKCMYNHLTGKYEKGNVTAEMEGKVMCWSGFHGNRYSLKQARMMVKPRERGSSVLLPHERV